MSPSFSFTGSFAGGTSEWYSDSISLNEGVITNATMTAEQISFNPSIDNFTLFLTNDGGTTWETISLGIKNTFSSSGQDLRIKIKANSGSVIKLKQTDGRFTPIKVKYEI